MSSQYVTPPIVSPTSIRSRILKVLCGAGIPRRQQICFTHVDPFEDTERSATPALPDRQSGFTHVDPFEDTERNRDYQAFQITLTFHPRRSVRGY